MAHPHRDDIFINEVLTPHNEIKESDKMEVNRILLVEVANRKSIKITY
ncbi:MAG: hypothetical protein ACFFHD_08635 [Promethearchaeota archaeon]